MGKRRSMKIEIGTIKDLSSLAILNKRLVEDEKYPNPMNIAELDQRMRNWIKSEYTVYTIKKDDDILGYCLYRDDEDFYYIRQLYIDRHCRRKGLATKLLDWMYSNIWIDKKTRLDVLSDNYRAIGFYESYGFKARCINLEK